MEYEYCPIKLVKIYENNNEMKRKYGKIIADGMLMFLADIDAAINAYDLKVIPFYHMEHKKGNLKEYYSISLDNKKSKWRLMIQMLNEDNQVILPTENEKEFLKNVKKIRIKELSDHYEKY